MLFFSALTMACLFKSQYLENFPKWLVPFFFRTTKLNPSLPAFVIFFSYSEEYVYLILKNLLSKCKIVKIVYYTPREQK